MIAPTLLQTPARTPVRSVRVTGHRAGEALSAFLRDAGDFVEDNLLLLVVLVVLAIIVFHVTRPRVH